MSSCTKKKCISTFIISLAKVTSGYMVLLYSDRGCNFLHFNISKFGNCVLRTAEVHVECPILWKLRLIFKFRCGRDPAEVHAEKKQRGGGSVNKPRFVLQHF